MNRQEVSAIVSIGITEIAGKTASFAESYRLGTKHCTSPKAPGKTK